MASGYRIVCGIGSRPLFILQEAEDFGGGRLRTGSVRVLPAATSIWVSPEGASAAGGYFLMKPGKWSPMPDIAVDLR